MRSPNNAVVNGRQRRGPRARFAVVALALLGWQTSPTLARPGEGYGDLIDNYCIGRGRLRVRAHQPHCAMCHHLGTFDTSPEHRIEPNWNEFIRGRTTSDFSFFCPGGSDSTQTARAPGEALPSGPKNPMAETAERLANPMGMPPGASQPLAAPAPEGKQPSAAPSEGQTVTAPPPTLSDEELSRKMAALHDALGITPAQEPAWLDLLDTAARALQTPAPPPGSAKDPAMLLKTHELQSSRHVVMMRGVGLALARLNAGLSDGQRQTLAQGLGPILGAIRP